MGDSPASEESRALRTFTLHATATYHASVPEREADVYIHAPIGCTVAHKLRQLIKVAPSMLTALEAAENSLMWHSELAMDGTPKTAEVLTIVRGILKDFR
jgi:hypothetical protein